MTHKRILIVEDNLMNLELATDLLELEGHEVLQARSAEEGIVSAKTHQPDLILMDIDLPGMNGLTATRKLKQTPATEHIKVIALTAFAMKADEQRARKSGCEGFLTKPISTRTFAQQISAFLGEMEDGR